MVECHKAAEEAIDIGSRLELSVDDYLIEVMGGKVYIGPALIRWQR
jgi:sorbitol-specific phosphotransferase system component IIA